MATPDKETEVDASEWSSTMYGGRVHGTADARFLKDDVVELTVKYSAYSVYRGGESHVFKMNFTRSLSFAYGRSTPEALPRIFVAIPLDGSMGEYVTQGPQDHGTMVFDKSWIDKLVSHIPNTSAARPEEMNSKAQVGCTLM